MKEDVLKKGENDRERFRMAQIDNRIIVRMTKKMNERKRKQGREREKENGGRKRKGRLWKGKVRR